MRNGPRAASILVVAARLVHAGKINYKIWTIPDHRPQETQGRSSSLDQVDRARLQRVLDFGSRLAPLPCRDDFAAAAQAHFNQTGRAAEIGVFRGDFAMKNVEKWKGVYYAIDSWGFRTVDVVKPGRWQDKNTKSNTTNEDNYRATERKLRRVAGSRAILIRGESLKVVNDFPDGFFDWLYIDALHSRAAVTQDLRAWWRKLRPGGLFSGDDYLDKYSTPYFDLKRARANYGPTMSQFDWGVIGAVQQFAADVGGQLHVTFLRDCYPFPAWYMIKP